MSSPLEILKSYWGYASFRPLQQKVIEEVIAGQDLLVLMPTGG
jgi:ATP-dependent DNA helicase RecQ